jgi:hypothetical protein
MPKTVKCGLIIGRYQRFNFLPEDFKFRCDEMRSDRVEHMPMAQEYPTLRIHCLQGVNLCLVTICHDDSGPDLWIGVPDPFDKEGNNLRCPV